MIKKIIQRCFERLGLEVKKIKADKKQTYQAPVILNNPWEALYRERGGVNTAFKCPLNKCVIFNGFGFGESKWHPFEATAKQLLENIDIGYTESTLCRYYNSWAPNNALEALTLGQNCAPDTLSNYKSFAAEFMFPWSSENVNELEERVTKAELSENREHGDSTLNIFEDGYKWNGPVSEDKGRLEFKRIKKLVQSIQDNGYERIHGDLIVGVIKHNGDHRFLISGSHHRAAVLSALGYEYMPAVYISSLRKFRNRIWEFDTNYVKYWPQIKNGLWSEKVAVEYVEFLFFYNSQEWAESMILNHKIN